VPKGPYSAIGESNTEQVGLADSERSNFSTNGSKSRTECSPVDVARAGIEPVRERPTRVELFCAEGWTASPSCGSLTPLAVQTLDGATHSFNDGDIFHKFDKDKDGRLSPIEFVRSHSRTLPLAARPTRSCYI
jgi:hypothetical protein